MDVSGREGHGVLYPHAPLRDGLHASVFLSHCHFLVDVDECLQALACPRTSCETARSSASSGLMCGRSTGMEFLETVSNGANSVYGFG
jgi:hypothetical protein